MLSGTILYYKCLHASSEMFEFFFHDSTASLHFYDIFYTSSFRWNPGVKRWWEKYFHLSVGSNVFTNKGFQWIWQYAFFYSQTIFRNVNCGTKSDKPCFTNIYQSSLIPYHNITFILIKNYNSKLVWVYIPLYTISTLYL